MAALKTFKIRRPDNNAWNYLVEITDDQGTSMQLNACFEDLDKIAFEVEEQMTMLVEAAERKGMSG